MAAEFMRASAALSSACRTRWEKSNIKSQIRFPRFTFRASHSTDDKDKVHKHLGLFALKKKIEETILHAELLAPAALKHEEARWIKQEQIMRGYDLWDDLAKSDEVLAKLADSTKLVDALKDLRYKAEEAKLISQLAEKEAIDFGLFEQAYAASLDVSKILRQYELSKLLKGPYEMEGACLTIEARSEGKCNEIWAGQLVSMYTKWAEKQGYKGRVVEKCTSTSGAIKYATIEFEFERAYGYLLGERGVHRMSTSSNGSIPQEASIASVDVIPLFLETACDLQVEDKDLVLSTPLSPTEAGETRGSTICIHHIPTGISVQSSGERSHFANKLKALNRLKAKLLVIAKEQGVSDVTDIKRDIISEAWQIEARSYTSCPHKLVQDMKTGIQLRDLPSVLEGNLDPLISARISLGQSGNLV